ncbi:MAG: hypothetical protein FJ354_00775 [Thaumarchaeota archaeon]|nr:hypothetical protein [Nitrososphaerota archaeon]
MKYSLKIKKLDIQESYFVGKAELLGNEYTINIQHEGRYGKAILLPSSREKIGEKILVSFTGSKKHVEDFLTFAGESEWIEIDSNEITNFIADNQDEFDNLEIVTGLT